MRIFPVGRRGARPVERQPAVRSPMILIMPFKVADPRLCSRYGRPGRRAASPFLLEIDVGERLPFGVGATKMRLGLPTRAAFY
jgi:hypothetical protein